MHILVVDDDPLAGAMIGAILEDAGHQVSLAEHGVEALERLAAETDIGLVLSDMNMPLVSGLELFRTLREQGLTTPFVLLTGDDPAALLQQEPRLDGCLMKDFELEEILLAKIAALTGA
jgi:CheY-like chemotaxis protein